MFLAVTHCSNRSLIYQPAWQRPWRCTVRTTFTGVLHRPRGSALAAAPSVATRRSATPSHRRLRVYSVNSNDFRPGTSIEVDGVPYKVVEQLHVKPGKGAAFVRTKLRNMLTGSVLERTFRANENVADALLEKVGMKFTYKDGDNFVFMNMSTFEEERLSPDQMGNAAKYMKEQQDVQVLTWNGRVLEVELPAAMVLEVTETAPGLKGDTVQGGSKPATLETGVVIQVPLFITVGEKVKVDTRTGTYLSRG